MSTFSQFLDPTPFGADIATTSSGDIAEVGKDIGTISGVDNVINSFVRELLTPLGYLARWAYDVDGLKILDEDYGNSAYLQLSEPLTEAWISDMITHITLVADEQPRIVLQAVDYTLVPETNSIGFKISFTIPQETKTFNLLLNPLSGSLEASLAVED